MTRPDAPQPVTPSQWTLLDEKRLARCRIFDLYQQQHQRTKDNRSNTFYVIKTHDWVQVIPLTPTGELTLVQQYRFGTQELSWEVPGGVIDPGENATTAAIRELREETGLAGEDPQTIGHCRPNPAIQNNTVHYVLIRNCTLQHQLQWDEDEELAIQSLPLKQVYTMIDTGKIVHSHTINALFFLARLRHEAK